jgi:DNA-binding LytR/AlgR family response regulator
MALSILIVEDEPFSAQKLVHMLSELVTEGQIVATLDSVRSTVKWLKDFPAPDLAFFDIQLADGICFEVFEQTRIVFPVIFTTAFNEYALKAFKVNSIDYLLKPLKEEELQAALKKFRDGFFSKPVAQELSSMAATLNLLTNSYKSRFLVKVGEHLKMIPVGDIALFYSMEKAVFVKTGTGQDLALDFTLEQINSLVDPRLFFRISRSHIVSLAHITDVVAHSGSRLVVKFSVKMDRPVVVSREKVQAFKAWLEG